jgi:hypothetical protein
MRVIEHATHRLFVGVEKLRGEHGFQVFGDGEIQHDVQRIASLGLCNFGKALLLIRVFSGLATSTT